uniref:Uncharacterized protein n=1 Tax=Periophthalmus magnuspinnatus TaxID=409849 RepID=A0A3B4AJR0_9GOBI
MFCCILTCFLCQGLKSPQENMADLSPVESLRIPSQEEMREPREQPLDPSTEQEIIDSIEEVYFSSDSFDMVQYELEVSVKHGLYVDIANMSRCVPNRNLVTIKVIIFYLEQYCKCLVYHKSSFRSQKLLPVFRFSFLH